MFGIGSTELLVILVVALIVLGPKSIPGLAKTLGKVMGEFRRVSTDFQRTMNAEMAQEEHEKRKKEAEEELFGSKAKAEQAEQPAPQAAPQPEPAAAPSSAAAATVDAAPVPPAAPVDASTGTQPASDSPLAQAVARAEAEARGAAQAAEPQPAENPAAKSGEKA